MIKRKKKLHNHSKGKVKSASANSAKKHVKRSSVSFISHASADALDSFKTVHVSEAEMKNRRKMVSKSVRNMKAVLGDF